MQMLIPLVASYLIGSIPFGFLIAKIVKGIDIRQHGSGNIGATNVFRVVGKAWGIAVFILDFLKGLAAPMLAIHMLDKAPQGYLVLLCAIISVIGHNWTLFLAFKGGKGVATSVGAIFGLGFAFKHLWLILLLSLAVWGIVFLIYRYVSLASILAAVGFVVFSFVFKVALEVKLFSLLLMIFIIVRHKKNIRNILAHKEYKF